MENFSKKEIFDRIRETLIKDPNFKVSKISKAKSNQPYFTVRSKDYIDLTDNMKQAKAMLITNPEQFKFLIKGQTIGREQTYHTVIFNEERNSIHVKENTFGFKFAQRKMRIYPIVKSKNLYTWTKHLYTFIYDQGMWMPRIYSGGTEAHWILKPMLNISFMPEFNMKASYRHIIDATCEGDVYERKHNIKIPKAIKRVLRKTEDIQFFIDTIDEASWNTVCQVISKRKLYEEHEGEPKVKTTEELVYHHLDENNKDDGAILIYSHCVPIIRDHLRLLIRRNEQYEKFSFKIKSFRRIEEEHDRLSQQRILEGVPEVKVHEKYIKLTEKIINENLIKDVQIELIRTKERIVKESHEMKHCVATYAHRINRAECCIWSVKSNGMRLTAEIRNQVNPYEVKHTDYGTEPHYNSFNLSQLKGVRNNRNFTQDELIELTKIQIKIEDTLRQVKA